MFKLLAFLKVIRLQNLVMLVLVQLITSFIFVGTLDNLHLVLISLSTIFIAASGNLINDFYDYDLDIANDKHPYFQRHSLRNLAILYSLLGLFIGLYLSFISHFLLFTFFAYAFIVLWSYAVFFSKYKIIGNILISSLIAQAIMIVPFFDYLFSSEIIPNSSSTVIDYAILAFLFNWLREIVKDLEDQKGDALFGRKTLPIFFGEFNTKIIVTVLIFTINLFLYKSHFGENMYILVPIALGSLILLIGVFSAKSKKEFKLASLFIKMMMLYGLLSPLF